jgi:hypothetical protein
VVCIPNDIWREIIYWSSYMELFPTNSGKPAFSLRQMTNLLRTCTLFRDAVYLRWNPLQFLMNTNSICPPALPLAHLHHSVEGVRGLMRFKAIRSEPSIFVSLIFSWIKLHYRGSSNPAFSSLRNLL